MRIVSTIATLLLVSAALGQEPPASQPASQPAITARVIEVKGDVSAAPSGSSEWKKVALNDEFSEQTVIRTGIRSSVKLQVGQQEPFVAVVIDSISKVELSQAYQDAEVKRVRLGLGYGRIRAGVAEGGVQSDLTVDSPVATLSKRGTWNFGMYYERATDRFEVFLLDFGLVEALNRVTNAGRTLSPGELVTNAMRLWADQAQILRNVPIADLLGQQDIEVAFNRLDTDGLGVIDPDGGYARLLNLSNSMASANFAQQLQNALHFTPVILPNPSNPATPSGPFRRPEGSFGTGRGDELVQVLIDQNNMLAKNGFARPGRYVFRRDVAQNWLATKKR